MKRVFVIAAFAVACGSAACSSTGESTFGDGAGSRGGTSPDGTPSVGNGLPDIGPTGTSSACVTEVAGAALAPTNLVFVFDKSGSMGDAATGFDPAKRWNPVRTGLKEFFADPYSKTLRASLQFFPPSNDEDDTIESVCAHPYASPLVPLAAASDPAFVSAIDDATPGGGTPTLPALEGGIAYAKEIAAERPGDKTAVVLVTDGEPGFWNAASQRFEPGCTDNTVANVSAAAARARAAGIPTYVIGVGPQLQALDSVAAAGGTTSAIMIEVDDPGATTAQIKSALADIRRREIACDFALPPPPTGQELDPNAVNVVLAEPSGAERILGYSRECADESGWRYDVPNAPTRIMLCAAACTDAKTSTEGQVSIAFGCKTKAAVR